jgi:Mn2+/Fe2+ NRAMP family transporter
MLIAATGVGAGDLATASFSGSHLGVAVLWAVVVGGVFKYFLTEGLARWQLVTGKTFLEGVAFHFGKLIGWLFLPYLLLWSFFVGSALISACGITLHALFPVWQNPVNGKIWFGIISSLTGFILVWLGGFSLFEKIMGLCTGLMFLIVLFTAFMQWPGTMEVLSGIFIPVIPDIKNKGISWTLALIGGVGGTLTILSYGYWIREKGRTTIKDLNITRLDLAVGYSVTIFFGMAMVIIGSTIKIGGSGAGLLIILSQKLAETTGPVGSVIFLIGAFCAVFSSLLGVWQSVPYLFADAWHLFSGKSQIKNLQKTIPYKLYLTGISIIPMAGLMMTFKETQKLYAITGSLFIPFLAIALLIMNGKKSWVNEHTNRVLTTFVLFLILCFFIFIAVIN